MTTSSLSPLLDLPFELRNQIYRELLCPTANEAITLYRVPYGRSSTLNMHPQILLVNKQTYDEALPLLYTNTYKIDLTSPNPGAACHGLQPRHAPDLFISPAVRYMESTRDWCYTKKGNFFSTKGKFYPYVFRPLRHVVVETEDNAVWESRTWGAIWSRRGDLVHETLRCLSEDVEKEDTGRAAQTLAFKFTVSPDPFINHLFTSHGERNEISRGMEAVLSLLTVIRKSRKVTATAELLSKDGCKLGDIDIEKWVASLQ